MVEDAVRLVLWLPATRNNDRPRVREAESVQQRATNEERTDMEQRTLKNEANGFAHADVLRDELTPQEAEFFQELTTTGAATQAIALLRACDSASSDRCPYLKGGHADAGGR